MSGIIYYDKDGTTITDTIEWAKLYEDHEYRRVAAEATKDGKYFVSTIWKGLCSPIEAIFTGEGPVGIFETAVFKEGGEQVGEYHWDTLTEAMAGHDMAVHRFGGEDE